MRAQRTAYFQKYRAKNKSKIQAKRQNWSHILRAEVLKHYGGRCSCCQESIQEFLTVIPNGGQKPPKKRSIFYWLRQQGLPTGYTVLCMNCSASFFRHGYCLHRPGGVI